MVLCCMCGRGCQFANSRMNPGRPWPRLLNTAEMFTYAGMAILFLQDKHCKMVSIGGGHAHWEDEPHQRARHYYKLANSI